VCGAGQGQRLEAALCGGAGCIGRWKIRRGTAWRVNGWSGEGCEVADVFHRPLELPLASEETCQPLLCPRSSMCAVDAVVGAAALHSTARRVFSVRCAAVLCGSVYDGVCAQLSSAQQQPYVCMYVYMYVCMYVWYGTSTAHIGRVPPLPWQPNPVPFFQPVSYILYLVGGSAE